MDVNLYKFRQISRYIAAVIFMLAPWLAMPLAFGRFGGLPVPLFGLVKGVTLPVMTWLSLAVIAAFPEDLKQLWHNEKLKLLLAASGVYTLLIVWQCFAGYITFEEWLGGAFWVAGPLAAAALGRELRCCLPYFAAVGALLLFWSGCTSENFTGLPGNWNWNCGILTALIPGIFLAGKYKYWKHYSTAALILFFAVWFLASPERFPRSAFFAALAAWSVIFLRNRLPERYFYRTLVIVSGIAAGIFFFALSVFDIPDTRFQIWRGALNFLPGKLLTGAGAGHFAEIIRENLYETFYFTEFATGHIDHAHNDLLNISVECGIAGAIFYFAAVFTILPVRAGRSGQDILAKWIFAVMLFCGCFDQHNITVIGGFCLALSAGILLMPEGRKPVALPCRLAIPGMVAGIILLLTAVSDAVVNYQVTTFIRQGDMKLLRGDIDGALSGYLDSMRQKKTLHALYQSAELYLVKQRPENTLKLIGTMENELHMTNYRHTMRLKAVAALQTGDMGSAVTALNQEMINAPFSVINAHFQCFLVRAAGMDDTVINAADQHLTELCRMRGIEVSDIQHNWSVEMDDAAFAPEVRRDHNAGSNIPLEMMMNFAGMLILLFGSFGAGKLLLYKQKDIQVIPACACGLILCGVLTLFLPVQMLFYALAAAALPGVWFAVKALKANWKYALFFGLLFLTLLPAAFLPPSSWDEQVYQIALIKRYLALNSTDVLPNNPYSAYPSLGQLLTLPGCFFGGLNVPLLTVWALNCLMAGQFFMLGRRYGKYTAALALSAVMLSPLACNMLRAFYVESFITFFGFAGCLLIFNCKKDQKIYYIITAGVMAGAAAAVKLTGAGVSLMLFILLLSDRDQRRWWWCFAGAAVITALPFFLRVWIACGNPFYPYFSVIFNNTDSAIAVENFYRALGSNYGMGALPGVFFNWLSASVAGSDYDGITLGCQFVVFTGIIIAAVIRSKGRHKMLLRCTAALAGGWIFWNFTSQQTRFLYPLLWALAFLTVYALSVYSLKLRQIALMLLAGAVAITFYVEMAQFKHYILAWNTVGEARKNPGHFTAWVHDELSYAELITQLEELREYEVALLWERRTLYLPDNVEIITPGFQEKLTPAPQDPDTLYAFLQNYDYLVIRQPLTDVDKAVENSPDAVKLNELILELLRQGRVEPFRWTSDGQLSILRIVPEV